MSEYEKFRPKYNTNNKESKKVKGSVEKSSLITINKKNSRIIITKKDRKS